jgi:hypothetical protein
MRAKKENLMAELGITPSFTKSAWAKIVKERLVQPLETGGQALYEYSEEQFDQMVELTADERRKSEIQNSGPRAVKSLRNDKAKQWNHDRDYKPSKSRAQTEPNDEAAAHAFRHRGGQYRPNDPEAKAIVKAQAKPMMALTPEIKRIFEELGDRVR